VTERFALEQEGRALRRSWVADDPAYFEGQYTGSDVVYVSEVPYQPAPCEDLSYKSSSPDDDRLSPLVVWGGVAAAGFLAIAGVAARRLRRRGAR
jgi:hypothetical protein